MTAMPAQPASLPSVTRITATIETSDNKVVSFTFSRPFDVSVDFSADYPALPADLELIAGIAHHLVSPRYVTITMRTGRHPVRLDLGAGVAAQLARLEWWLHSRCQHPDFDYETTTGPRKAWDRADVPPEGDGWVRNTDRAAPDGWERFEYHEESYWMRPKADGVGDSYPSGVAGG